jgi:hypothetical protein
MKIIPLKAKIFPHSQFNIKKKSATDRTETRKK